MSGGNIGHIGAAQAQPSPQAPAGNDIPVTVENYNRAQTDV